MIVLTTAVVIPMIKHAGFDLVWFGIFVVLVVEMAEVSPPVGFNLFVLQGPNPEIVMRDPATHNYKQTDLIITAAGYDSWRGVVAGNA